MVVTHVLCPTIPDQSSRSLLLQSSICVAYPFNLFPPIDLTDSSDRRCFWSCVMSILLNCDGRVLCQFITDVISGYQPMNFLYTNYIEMSFGFSIPESMEPFCLKELAFTCFKLGMAFKLRLHYYLYPVTISLELEELGLPISILKAIASYFR